MDDSMDSLIETFMDSLTSEHITFLLLKNQAFCVVNKHIFDETLRRYSCQCFIGFAKLTDSFMDSLIDGFVDWLIDRFMPKRSDVTPVDVL